MTTLSTDGRRTRISAVISPIAIATIAVIASQPAARADEGGISFWLPGQFGSLAAVPAQPGWSFATVSYLTDVRASGAVAAARQITAGRFNPNVSVSLDVNLHARAPAEFVNATYVFASPVLGGQLAVGMTGAIGYPSASLDGTLTASVGGIATTRSGTISDQRPTFGDLYPTASLRWNQGVHNLMIYGMGDIPVGTYDPNNLANLGIGHGAADGGFGYTYFNPQTGYEFSAVTGLTYNFRNTQTDYQNGLNFHFDWGASKFLSPQMFAGLVGYIYNQVTADSGQSPLLGDFKSRVFAVGPQVGFLFPVEGMQGYLNLKGYYEFGAQNRAEGWNAWVTLAISPANKPAPSPLARIQK
jgi:hypothetical protein